MSTNRLNSVLVAVLFATPLVMSSLAHADEEGAQTRTQERTRAQNGAQNGNGEMKRTRTGQTADMGYSRDSGSRDRGGYGGGGNGGGGHSGGGNGGGGRR